VSPVAGRSFQVTEMGDSLPEADVNGRRRVVVLGGGTAGWMTAAALARLAGGVADVTLVESRDVGIVGVGEATLPHLAAFIRRLGIDERAFMAATDATYKLGIQFEDFGAIGDRYLHPFGSYGRPFENVAFHHWWLRVHAAGRVGRIDDFCIPIMAAEDRRFAHPALLDTADGSEAFGYAYHFDATRFAPFLRTFAERHGAQRVEGRVTAVHRAEDGNVRALQLETGALIHGDLFVDCSGFRALLIGDDAMDAPWEDWSHWLPTGRYQRDRSVHPGRCDARWLAVAHSAPQPRRQRLCLFKRALCRRRR
jgi:tryptophan halogenase